MSVYKFNLTEDHIKLVKQLYVNQDKENDIMIGKVNPFALEGFSIYDDISIILYGKTNDVEINDTGEDTTYTEEEKQYFEKLNDEIATALDIILFTGKFEPGLYITRTFERKRLKK